MMFTLDEIKNKILNVDYKQLLESIPDNSIDAVITDPPYGITEAKWDKNADVIDSYWWAQMKRIAKPNSAIVIFACHPFTNKLFTYKPAMYRYYQMIWVKSRASDFLNAKWKPMKRHEEIFVFYRKRTTYNPQRSDGKPYIAKSSSKASDLYRLGIDNHTTVNDGYRLPTTVLEFASINGFHPTQKPIDLLEYLIKTYSGENDIILDPFLGSGTTALAAYRTNRHYLGSELNTEYFNYIQEAMEKEKNIKTNTFVTHSNDSKKDIQLSMF